MLLIHVVIQLEDVIQVIKFIFKLKFFNSNNFNFIQDGKCDNKDYPNNWLNCDNTTKCEGGNGTTNKD
jgi:hypothetical protein